MSALGEMFLRHLPEEVRRTHTGGAELSAALARWIARGRAAWPDIQLQDEELLMHLAARLSPDHRLERVHAEGLYLACACLTGNATAAARFRAHYQPVMDAVFRRLGLGRNGEEISQRVLHTIFVGDGHGAPAMSGYGGRGSLANWLRVIAVREAYRVTRQERRISGRERASSEERIMERAITSETNPELLHLKRDYRVKFKASFQSAFAGLDNRERNILRYQYLDGLNLDQIATIYAVSRATVARWRAQARARLLAETRRIMRDEHRVPVDEFEGAVRLIESAMDVSLSRLLKKVAREEDTSRR